MVAGFLRITKYRFGIIHHSFSLGGDFIYHNQLLPDFETCGLASRAVYSLGQLRRVFKLCHLVAELNSVYKLPPTNYKLLTTNYKLLTKKTMSTIDDLKKIEIRVGKILSAERVENSEKLVKLQVSFGTEGERQIIAGIGPHFPELEAIIGNKYAFVFNLEPRTLMGLESQGMILAAGETDAFSLLSVNEAVPEGSLVR